MILKEKKKKKNMFLVADLVSLRVKPVKGSNQKNQ